MDDVRAQADAIDREHWLRHDAGCGCPAERGTGYPMRDERHRPILRKLGLIP